MNGKVNFLYFGFLMLVSCVGMPVQASAIHEYGPNETVYVTYCDVSCVGSPQWAQDWRTKLKCATTEEQVVTHLNKIYCQLANYYAYLNKRSLCQTRIAAEVDDLVKLTRARREALSQENQQALESNLCSVRKQQYEFFNLNKK